MPATKYNKVCSQCGSDDVFLDASAKWDIHTQQWVLDEVTEPTSENSFCNECSDSTTLHDVAWQDTPADLLHAALDAHFNKEDK